MRSYDDISERVFRKGDKILEKRRKRTAIIKKISFSVSGICAVILVGFGVWTNDYIKNQTNSLLNDNQNNQIITENETDSERNKESMSQTSTTEYKNNRTYLSETVTSTEVSDVFLSTTISADNGFSENIIYTTTVTNQIFSVNTTEIQTEHIPETVQTTVSTTVQTNKMETEITNPPQNIDDERSLYMKKFMSFISALTIMNPVMPTMSNSSGVPFKVNPVRYWPGEKAIFAKMESGELDVDINGNGEFDIMDCYLLDAYRSEYYSYENDIDPEIVQRIKKIADYDGNGTVDFDDTLHLMRYFIVDGNIKYEYLDPAYYDPDIEPLTTEDDLINFGKYKEIQAYVFPMRMFYHVGYLQARYYLIDELYQSGKADLDINGNGQLDVDDVYRMHVFFTENENLDVDDIDRMHIFFTENENEVINQILTEEEYQKCWDFSFHYSEHLVPHHYDGYIMSIEVAAYILNHIEVKQEYFTKAYYKENIEDYISSYKVSALMIDAAHLIGIEISDNIGPAFDISDFYNTFDMTFFDSYCSDIENGIRPAPDVNMDGVVDYRDYFDINIYWSDRIKGSTAERSILPAETWNNINENYDLDGNGYSGGIDDLTAVQLYVIKYADEIDDVDGSYNEYVKSLCETPETISTTANYEDNVKLLSKIDEKRSGDVNLDGKVNVSDAVLIMQSISNPEEFQITEQGRYNADVYKTGDGVTASDALLIQLWEIGMSRDIYEIEFE